jgi:hypothetical protein
MNQVVLTGRLIKDFIQKEDMWVSKIRLTDNDANEISFRVTNGMYENLKQYIRIGSIVGIKGHLIGSKNGLRLIADKITFLS